MTRKKNESKLKREYEPEMSTEEIANILGVSRQRVEQLLKSGLKKLKTNWIKENDDEH